jgi:hypothetical protein
LRRAGTFQFDHREERRWRLAGQTAQREPVVRLLDGQLLAGGQQCRAAHGRRQPGERQLLATVPEPDNQVEIVAFLRLPAARHELADFAGLDAVDSFAMHCEPAPDRVGALDERRREVAVSVRTDVEEQVAAFAGCFDQHVQQHVGRAPAFAGCIAPQAPGTDLARFPEASGVRGDVMFRRAEVTERGGLVRAEWRDVFLGRHTEPVVDQDVWLQGTNLVHEFRRAPVFLRVRPGAVEPQHINLAIAGQEFLHLVVNVLPEG